MENYSVKYYGHSAYSLETDSVFILFDYVGEASFSYGEETFVVKQSKIDFDSIKKPILLLHSHLHFDHYNPELNKKLSTNNNIFTIVGEPIPKINNTTYLQPGDSFTAQNVNIFTFDSTDSGVSFVLKVDGLTIYYAGDNIDWGVGIECSEKYIACLYDLDNFLVDGIDIAFVPVCSFGGYSNNMITESAIFTCRELSAKVVYPMHSCGDNMKPYEDFKEESYSIVDNHYKVIIPSLEP